MRSLGFKVVDEFSHDRARSEQRIAPGIYAIIRYFTYRNALAGSNTGGIRETQDMVDFCALNKIKPEITKISMNGIDDAWTKVVEKKARYRYVIDMKA